MTDKQYKKTKKRVNKALDWWIGELGLKWWDEIIVRFHRDVTDAPDPLAVGHVTFTWCYQQATINFYLPNLVNKSDRELEKIVVHELVHILTAELLIFNSDDTNHKEHGTTVVTKAFLWVRDQALRDAKRNIKGVV